MAKKMISIVVVLSMVAVMFVTPATVSANDLDKSFLPVAATVLVDDGFEEQTVGEAPVAGLNADGIVDYGESGRTDTETETKPLHVVAGDETNKYLEVQKKGNLFLTGKNAANGDDLVISYDVKTSLDAVPEKTDDITYDDATLGMISVALFSDEYHSADNRVASGENGIDSANGTSKIVDMNAAVWNASATTNSHPVTLRYYSGRTTSAVNYGTSNAVTYGEWHNFTYKFKRVRNAETNAWDVYLVEALLDGEKVNEEKVKVCNLDWWSDDTISINILNNSEKVTYFDNIKVYVASPVVETVTTDVALRSHLPAVGQIIVDDTFEDVTVKDTEKVTNAIAAPGSSIYAMKYSKDGYSSNAAKIVVNNDTGTKAMLMHGTYNGSAQSKVLGPIDSEAMVFSLEVTPTSEGQNSGVFILNQTEDKVNRLGFIGCASDGSGYKLDYRIALTNSAFASASTTTVTLNQGETCIIDAVYVRREGAIYLDKLYFDGVEATISDTAKAALSTDGDWTIDKTSSSSTNTYGDPLNSSFYFRIEGQSRLAFENVLIYAPAEYDPISLQSYQKSETGFEFVYSDAVASVESVTVVDSEGKECSMLAPVVDGKTITVPTGRYTNLTDDIYTITLNNVAGERNTTVIPTETVKFGYAITDINVDTTTYDVTVNMVNTTNEIVDGSLFAAFYKNGKVVAMSPLEGTADGPAYWGAFSGTFNVADVDLDTLRDSTMKVFVWNNLTNIKPLMPDASFNVNDYLPAA